MHSPDVTAAVGGSVASSVASTVAAIYRLPDEAATERFGALLAPLLSGGRVLYLEGDLGAGKTTLARALIRALGHAGPVKSPTYSLVEVYVVSSLYLYHFDFYRFESPEEFLDAGFGDYFNKGALCLVEWPERAAGFVPPPDIRLRLRHEGPGRALEIAVHSQEGAQCLEGLALAWSVGNSAGSCCAPPAPR